jgi:hypothetical protein
MPMMSEFATRLLRQALMPRATGPQRPAWMRQPHTQTYSAPRPLSLSELMPKAVPATPQPALSALQPNLVTPETPSSAKQPPPIKTPLLLG